MRTEVIGDATLYLGDCLEIMPTLGKVDAVFTDPPWNMGYFKNDEMTWEDYADWLETIIAACRSALKRRGPIWIFQSTKAIPFVAHLFRGWGMFVSVKNFSQMSPTCLPNCFDVAFYNSDEGYKGKGRNWFLSNTAGMLGERTDHPTPRAVDVMTYIIDLYWEYKNLILDPFMGSGTTGVACMNLGRKFIGIEINEDYFNIACKRIDQAQRQGQIFQPEKPKVEQLSIG